MKRVLIIDDELAAPAGERIFSSKYAIPGVLFEFAASFEEAIRLQYWNYSLILLDIRFEGIGDEHGLDILKKIRERVPLLPVIMLSSRTAPGILIRCWDIGAQAYIVKWDANPEFYEELQDKVARFALYKTNKRIIGVSPKIRGLLKTIDTLADYDLPVLITGETGVGKELVANTLHDRGGRSEAPFVAINCGAIPQHLVESTLFGYAKGAFTGATADRKGKVDAAEGGTLFLDEVGDLPLEIQVKLLRLLDNGEFNRVGDSTLWHADMRIVAATNRILEQLVAEQTFREDLFFRINGFRLEVPALRERPDDIPLLAEHFLELFKNKYRKKLNINAFSSEAMSALQGYSWPGNVRELNNIIERAAILTHSSVIEIDALPPEMRNSIGNGVAEKEKRSKQCLVNISSVPENTKTWPKQRILSELQMVLEAKHRIQKYKGNQWKAEFMRLMYPECKAQNAKGFNDLIRRLTKGPWGDPEWEKDQKIKTLMLELKR